jgi:DNA-binding Lrp family transcriptional regulator
MNDAGDSIMVVSRRKGSGDLRIRLLRALQKNCAQTNKELSSALGADASVVSRLRHRCQQDGTIAGYRAVLNPRAFGKSTVGFVKLALIKTDEANLDATIAFFSSQPEVQEIHSIEGEYDLLVKLRVVSNADVLSFDTKKAIPKNNVRDTSTMLVFDTYKETGEIDL